jgi:hypothetical protein
VQGSNNTDFAIKWSDRLAGPRGYIQENRTALSFIVCPFCFARSKVNKRNFSSMHMNECHIVTFRTSHCQDITKKSNLFIYLLCQLVQSMQHYEGYFYMGALFTHHNIPAVMPPIFNDNGSPLLFK